MCAPARGKGWNGAPVTEVPFQPFAGSMLLIGNLNGDRFSMRAWILASVLLPAALAAQQDPPSAPAILSRADEIRYAKSAAPADISEHAKVLVLENGHYVVAEQGTSDVVCEVARNSSTSFEPQCGDAEADSTILAIFRFRTEERISGRSQDQIKADVDNGIASNRFHVPKRPALVYMESASQVLTDAAGNNRSHFLPHLMIFYPDMKNGSMGIVASKSADVPGVVLEGTPMSGLIVVTRDWVNPDMNK
jgi:hypothetical protein